MKERKTVTYESPVTREMQISLESGICAGSANVQNPNDNESGQIDAHEDGGFSTTWSGNSGWEPIS